MSVNKVILLGNVGNDPMVRYPQQDFAVASFSLATNEVNGQTRIETTEWHRIVAAGRLGSLAERYIRKGTQLYVEGKLRTREYEDKMHIMRKITEIYAEKIELLGRAGQQ
ncbi:MAG: single-stranded DNA-binding protein [Prevotella sp.]|nr:single-stranded DNA-binding protein [Bacteroides sp.]MCM1366070.1 single-stranded DNA-binding protein [Prevotella sp.]MCM1436555.1 single-stranded DNA-binding protein [Prevotella sp.]